MMRLARPFAHGADGRIHPIEIVTDHGLAGFGAVVAAFLGLGETPAPGIKPGGIKVAQGIPVNGVIALGFTSISSTRRSPAPAFPKSPTTMCPMLLATSDQSR
jgi:hypothetical protein